ncbi:MAG: spermidine synthase [Planctomycetes bacterium]|nr:spermidine synthase [Planctomycetota bacterium]
MNLSLPFRLFFLSLLLLFFELALIRWIAANVYYVGYFTNFVLMSCLLGIGIGCLVRVERGDLFRWFPLGLAGVVAVVQSFTFEAGIPMQEELHFQATARANPVPLWILIPLLFLSLGGLMACLAQPLGGLLKALPPLRAYTLNILGSLAGILVYTALAFVGAPPIIWFGLSLGGFFVLCWKRWRIDQGVAAVAILAFLGLEQAGDVYWSPYYKIRLSPHVRAGTSVGWDLQVNGVGHQVLVPPGPEWTGKMYHTPYQVLGTEKRLEDVLIIGAGGGSDVAVALSYGVRRVDAVEIDPVILDLGSKLHPSLPYQDPRVEVAVDDGRAFLRKTEKKYDLVLFALPDSLTLASSYTSLRLENFLFTRECFQAVRERLKPDGVFALYNYYREYWYIQKLAKMLEEVFRQKPLVYVWGQEELLPAVLMVGPGMDRLPPDVRPGAFREDASLASATDDWPFTYLQRPAIPAQYLALFGMLIPISLAAVWAARGRERGPAVFSWHFFFMGAGFFLLEAKSLVQFALLFGSTWLVNALVFFAILLAVLLANGIVSKVRISRAWPLGTALALSLALNYFIPLERLLLGNWLLRYLLASAILFSPIFFANLLFSRFFSETRDADVGFASNLLGALAGGFFEYVSLVLGYRHLTLVVALFYALAIMAHPAGMSHDG